MKPIIILLLSIIYISKSEKELPTENGLTILTDDTFDEVVSKNDFLLIMFDAPDCGHCKQFQPIFEKASSGLRLNGIIPAKIDGIAQKKISERFHIIEYPTVRFFKKDSEPVDYNGLRKDDEIIEWCIRHKKPAYPMLFSKNEIENLKKEHNTTIVYFGNDKNDERYFTRIAYYITQYQFGQVTDENLMKEYNVKNRTVIMFKNYDDKRADYVGKIDHYKLNKWILLNALPKVKDFKDELIYKLVFGNDRRSALILFTNENDNKKIEEYKKMLYDVNIEIKGKLFTIITDIKSGNGKRAGEYAGIKEKDLPQVRIINTTGIFKKYVMQDEINTKNIIKFYNDYENGKVKLFYRSQEIPEKNDGNIFVLVADNYKKEVIENDKDVLVLFYAPWCAHCKSFSPIYEEIAAKLKKKNPKLLLAKVDATQNEIENIKVTGYPTLRFYPGDKKNSPIIFKGDRTEESIVKFLKENCYNKFDYDENEKNPDL